MNDDEKLLKEFEELIHTVGTEVSTRISAQVATEATKTLIQQQVFTELMQVQRNIVKLLQEVPKANQQMIASADTLNQSNQIYQNLLKEQKTLALTQKRQNSEQKEKADASYQQLQKAIDNLKSSKLEQVLEKQNKIINDLIGVQQSLFMKIERLNDNVANIQSGMARLEGKLSRVNSAIQSLKTFNNNQGQF